jgi:DNA-binding MarR family transcriptional regulator
MTQRKSADEESTRELAVVLHDLAWLLPRTIGAAAMQAEPQPPTALEVMRLLARSPGLSVNDVGREIGVQANNVSTAVTLLEERGLLEKRRDEEDGRVTRLHLTDHALEARARRERSWGESMHDAMAALNPTDAAALINASQALRALAEHLAQPERA